MDPHIPGAISFTDFLEDPNNEYVIGSSHISGEDSVPQTQVFSQMSPPEVESIAKKSQRGANFSIQEDNLLVSTFLNVNQDVVQSTNQKQGTYWKRISDYYHKWKTFESMRTQTSLSNRWSTIQQCTNKFCGYLSQIDSMNQSGMTEEDKLNKARQQYQTFQGSTFSYEHCWNLLKDSPKWLRTIQEHRLKKRRLETTSSSPTLEPIDLEDEDIPHVPNVLERPPGKKAEKERLKKQKSKEGTSSNMEALLNVMMEERRKMNEMEIAATEKGCLANHEQEMARIHLEDRKLTTAQMKMELEMEKLKEDREIEKLRLENMKEEKEIMMMNVSALPPMQQEYIHQRQMEILEKRRN
nr:uncharacterized protein LOC111998143 [Quercus suber]